jgi:predicted permease
VVIISEALARRYFANEEPIGKRLGSPNRWREIVGVMADVKHFGLDADTPPSMYFPASQVPARGMTIAVRTQGDPLSVFPALRSEVRAEDQNIAIAKVRPMSEVLSASITQQRFILLLLGCFATLALVLAAIGIYGVTSYAVIQRTHEIGIRMALGARSAAVLTLILKHGLSLALVGIALGLSGAFALTRLMKTLLFGVAPTDLLTFGMVSAALIIVVLCASFIPARRATKVDPLVALRYG